jgi:uncharacterized membrane protein YciS (DUF1049 family)
LLPLLEKHIKTKVNAVVSDTQKRIEYLIREVLEDFQSAYQRMENAIHLNLPSNYVSDYATLLGTAIKGVMIGVYGNMLAATIYARLNTHLAGAFLLTNPIGWAIAGLGIILFGGMVKNKIRSRFKETLLKQLNKQINDIAENISEKLKEAKFEIINDLRKVAEAPEKEIEAQLQQRENNFNELLNKQLKESDFEKKRQALMQKKVTLENSLQRLELLA